MSRTDRGPLEEPGQRLPQLAPPVGLHHFPKQSHRFALALGRQLCEQQREKGVRDICP